MPLEQREASIRRMYAAWSDGDLPAFLDGLHPDIELLTSGYFPDFDRAYNGHDGIRRFWSEMREPWEWFRMDLARLVDGGDAVVTESRWRTRGKESDVVTELYFGHVFHFRGALILRVAAFRSYEEALEAAGAR